MAVFWKRGCSWINLASSKPSNSWHAHVHENDGNVGFQQKV